jgi:hypothetical protein
MASKLTERAKVCLEVFLPNRAIASCFLVPRQAEAFTNSNYVLITTRLYSQSCIALLVHLHKPVPQQPACHVL